MKTHFESPALSAGTLTLALRWVIGWTYFSAFWRRLIIDNKLIPAEAGYIGEKFNHFLPNALGIKPLIEYLVSNPEALQTAMVTFTIVEAIVGLFLILGLFTRLMSIGVITLAMGILLGSGWLGTTCLDEWQIGVLGVSGGFTLFLTGSAKYSLDGWLMRKNLPFTSTRWFNRLGSGALPQQFSRLTLWAPIGIIALTLYTNQYFHGGVFGTLHNKSVRPKVEISEVRYADEALTFQLFRVEGADVYGSFLIGIEVLDPEGNVVKKLEHQDLAQFPKEAIENHYVAKIKPGAHSLVLPLGAKADLTLPLDDTILSKGSSLKLIDISGLEWTADIPIAQ